MKSKYYLLLLMLSFLLNMTVACRHKKDEQNKKIKIENLDESILNANKLIVRDEAKDIELLIQRYNWKMQSTGTGMFYSIDEDKQGKLLSKGDKVAIAYSISLIDGKEIYNSDRDGIKTIIIEQSDEPVGLRELLKKMSVGSKAKAVIPSHLAYGILGDNNKIPPYATLIYKIEILNNQ